MNFICKEYSQTFLNICYTVRAVQCSAFQYSLLYVLARVAQQHLRDRFTDSQIEYQITGHWFYCSKLGNAPALCGIYLKPNTLISNGIGDFHR